MYLDTDQVRWLLTHLYDNAALSGTSLLESIPCLANLDPQSRADRLRGILLDCIEFLRPAGRKSLRSWEARSYNVLWLRYVEGMTIEALCEEVSLSERQTHRELRAAEGKIAEVLAERLEILNQTEEATAAVSVEDGIDVSARPAKIDLAQVTAKALQTVQPLSARLGISSHFRSSVSSALVFADEGVLSQLLIQALSLAAQNARKGQVLVNLIQAEGNPALSIEIDGSLHMLEHQMLSALEALAEAVNARFEASEISKDKLTLSLKMISDEPKTIVVVEDSGAAIELYRRYLEPTGEWRVVAVREPNRAYDTVREVQPALVLLDLLMPATDGWTVLNMLHANDETACVPVVVCSVFQDPLLAQALGARAHLRKPFSQTQLLNAVRKWAR